MSSFTVLLLTMKSIWQRNEFVGCSYDCYESTDRAIQVTRAQLFKALLA